MLTGAHRTAWWLAGLAGAGLAAALGLAAAARRARLEPMLVRGGSMRPTLVPGQRIAVGPLVEPLHRGAVVVLRRPHREGLEVVKRVVGLPGERVRLVGGRLEVDGVQVPEPYLAGGGAGAVADPAVADPAVADPAVADPAVADPAVVADLVELDVRLGEGECLVLGDYRDASSDGRAFGPVRVSDLIGSVRFAYWPPRRLRAPG